MNNKIYVHSIEDANAPSYLILKYLKILCKVMS